MSILLNLGITLDNFENICNKVLIYVDNSAS